MENAKVLALRAQVREAAGAERVAEVLARPKVGRRQQDRIPRGPHNVPLADIPQPRRDMPTRSQLRVIEAISHGLTTQDSATVLGISYETAKSHIRGAKMRCAAKTRPQMVAICLREGWIH